MLSADAIHILYTMLTTNPKPRLTAAEARKLAGPTVTERVDEVLELVRKTAGAKGRTLSLHDDFWVHEGYSQSDKWKEAVKQLEDLGYKVTFFYEERQFVDMYTIVEW